MNKEWLDIKKIPAVLTGLHWTNAIHVKFILHSGLRETIKHKNKLYRMSLKHPKAYNETLYKQYRNMTTRLLRIEEKQYYQSQIEANRDNIRKNLDGHQTSHE